MLETGTILRLRTLRHYPEPGNGPIWLDFTAGGKNGGKNTVFVVCYLGIENKDGTNPLDVEAAMLGLGREVMDKCIALARAVKPLREQEHPDTGVWVRFIDAFDALADVTVPGFWEEGSDDEE